MATKYILKTWERMNRKQRFQENIMETSLNRCLGTFSLMMLGVGSMVGSGLYIIMGETAHTLTGPAIFISFLIGGLASLLSAWCYSEFGVSVPKTGSAYTYSFLTLGEFVAFIVGWNLCFDHVVGIAAISRGITGYVDSISDNFLSNINNSIFGSSLNFDLFVAIPIIILTILVATGIKSSSITNICFTLSKIVISFFIVILAIFVGSFSNWAESTRADGKGSGFLPYGYQSIFKGAAQAYFAYSGYDIIAISSEECANPSKSIPWAMAGSMMIVSLLYLLVSFSITLLIPTQYINVDSPFTSALDYSNVSWAVYPVTIGAFVAMLSALLGDVISLSRCIYAMAKDGLLLQFLKNVNQETQVPILADVLGSSLAVVFAILFPIEDLVNMVSIGTLQAYIMVALSLIVFRYSSIDPLTGNLIAETPAINDKQKSETEKSRLVGEFELVSEVEYASSMLTKQQTSTIFVFLCLQSALSVTLNWVFEMYEKWWYVIIIVILLIMTIGSVVYLEAISSDRAPQKKFRVPFVPYFPCLSIFINSYLMLQLNWKTWIRFGICNVVGLGFYFFYGIKHSTV